MLLWTRRSRAILLGVFGVVVVVVFVAPLATVVLAGTGRLVDRRAPVASGVRPLRRRTVRREPGQPVGEPADRLHRGRDRAGARHVGGARGARAPTLAEPRHRRRVPPSDRRAVGGDRSRPADRLQLAAAAARRHPVDRDPGARGAGAGVRVQRGVGGAGPPRPGLPAGRGIPWRRPGSGADADDAAAAAARARCCRRPGGRAVDGRARAPP